jgi:hypothetical protein
MTCRTTFSEVARMALANAETLLAEWLPDGRRRGREWTARNPTRADSSPGSFSINVQSGSWADFATGEKGGDLVSLRAYLTTAAQATAAAELAARFGLPWGAPRARSAGDWSPTRERPAPAYKDAPRAAQATPAPQHEGAPTLPDTVDHPRLGAPAATWAYTDAAGRPLWLACRFNHPSGGKDVLPLCWHGDRWRWKALPAPRPLYGLTRILANPDAPVVVVEGEKAADAAQAMLGDNVAVTTWPGGCKAHSQTDWQPLAGRVVMLWPDADEPGRDAMESAAGVLREKRSTAAIVNLPPLLPKGWDAADLLSDHLALEGRLMPAAFAVAILEGLANAPDGLCPICWAARIAAPRPGPTCRHSVTAPLATPSTF